MEVEQEDGCIKLHLDTYVKEMIEEYKNHIKRDLKPKQTPMQPGVVLTKDDCPETPDPKEQKFYRSIVQRLNLLVIGFVLMFHIRQLNWLDFVLRQVSRIGPRFII